MIFLRNLLQNQKRIIYSNIKGKSFYYTNNNSNNNQQMSTKILPLAVLDKCIGSNIWILMKSQREFAGVLKGFDDFFNMVLEGVTETWVEQNGQKQKRQMDEILLNGHDITFMVPGINPYQKKQI